MDCLNNLVGIWDGSTAKTDILYINDLPGFDLSLPDFLKKEQDESPITLLEGIRNKAGIFLKHEILGNLNPRVQMHSVLYNGVAGVVDTTRTVKTLEAAKYKGLNISVENYPYTQIYVDQISFYPVDNVTDLDVYLYDLTTGTLLDTYTFTVTGGEVNYYRVGKTYQNKGQYLNLALVVDSSLTDVYEVVTTAGCRSCNVGFRALNTYCSGRGVKWNSASDPIYSNTLSESHTNGLSMHYSVQCDHDYFVCSMANRFMLPMYYRFGIELMDEILHSDRLNSLTTIGRDSAKELKDDLINKYNATMQGILQNLNVPNNVCYTCTPNVAIRTRIP